MVLDVDLRFDELAPLLTGTRIVRLNDQSVRAGKHARDFEEAPGIDDRDSRGTSEAASALGQPDVEALRRTARSADNGARHTHCVAVRLLNSLREDGRLEGASDHDE